MGALSLQSPCWSITPARPAPALPATGWYHYACALTSCYLFSCWRKEKRSQGAWSPIRHTQKEKVEKEQGRGVGRMDLTQPGCHITQLQRWQQQILVHQFYTK